jgi:hypothetical protein
MIVQDNNGTNTTVNTQNKSFYKCKMESLISTVSRMSDYTKIDVLTSARMRKPQSHIRVKKSQSTSDQLVP